MACCDSEVIEDMNSTINKFELIDIFRMLHPTTENAFFSSAHATFMWLDHMVGYSQYLNKDNKNKELKPNMAYFYEYGIKYKYM